jgi:hypothetical protein
MKNKILLISLVAVLALSLSIAGCTGAGPGVELSLTFSDHNPPGNAMSNAMGDYADYIQSHSNGTVECTFIKGGALLKDVQVWDNVAYDVADAANYVPAKGDGLYYAQVLALPSMPYGIDPTREKASLLWNKLANNASFPDILAPITAHNVTLPVMYMMPGYNFHYFAANLTVNEPADMSGMEMMSLEDNLCDLIKTIPGVTATKIAFFDMFSIFPSPGGKDGFAMHNEFLHGAYGQEYFYSHTIFEGGGCMYTPIGILWNKAKYDQCVSLVGQPVMNAAAAKYLQTAISGTAVDTAGIWSFWGTRGDTIYTLNSTEQDAFDACFSAYTSNWVGNATNPTEAQNLIDTAIDQMLHGLY